MTAAQVIANFKAELEEIPDMGGVMLMLDPVLNGDPGPTVGILDMIVGRYCRARGAALELPEVTA